MSVVTKPSTLDNEVASLSHLFAANLRVIWGIDGINRDDGVSGTTFNSTGIYESFHNAVHLARAWGARVGKNPDFDGERPCQELIATFLDGSTILLSTDGGAYDDGTL